MAVGNTTSLRARGLDSLQINRFVHCFFLAAHFHRPSLQFELRADCLLSVWISPVTSTSATSYWKSTGETGAGISGNMGGGNFLHASGILSRCDLSPPLHYLSGGVHAYYSVPITNDVTLTPSPQTFNLISDRI